MHADRANMVLTTILLIIAFTIGPILLVTCWSLQARKRAEIRRLREEFKLQQAHSHQAFLPTQGPLPPGSAHGPRLCSANGFVVSPRFVSANGQIYSQPPPNMVQPPYYCTSDGRPFVPYFHEDERIQYFPQPDQRQTWGHYPLPQPSAVRQPPPESIHNNGNALMMRTEPVSLRPHLRERPASSLRHPDDPTESEPSMVQEAARQPAPQSKWTSLFPTIFRANDGGDTTQPSRVHATEHEVDIEAARRHHEGLTSCRTSAAGAGDLYASQGQSYFHMNEEAPLRDALLIAGMPPGPYPYQQGGYTGFGSRVPPLQQERITLPTGQQRKGVADEEIGGSNSTKDCSEYNAGPSGPS